VYEEQVRGTLAEVLDHFRDANKIKGEIVIVLAGQI
jgi:16S rRNA C1402 (ribose-2'-O) methylase RsmI